MRCPESRSRGLFVGTGVMEAACKTVIGTRVKRSGMFWTVRGANAIIALRGCQLSGGKRRLILTFMSRTPGGESPLETIPNALP
jgi:hypothetical protein